MLNFSFNEFIFNAFIIYSIFNNLDNHLNLKSRNHLAGNPCMEGRPASHKYPHRQS